MPVRICAGKDCQNTDQNCQLTFFSFPVNNPERMKKWLENILVKDSTKKKKVLCSVHFAMEAFTDSTKKRLHRTAIPTIQNPGFDEQPKKHPCLEGFVEIKNESQTAGHQNYGSSIITQNAQTWTYQGEGSMNQETNFRNESPTAGHQNYGSSIITQNVQTWTYQGEGSMNQETNFRNESPTAGHQSYGSSIITQNAQTYTYQGEGSMNQETNFRNEEMFVSGSGSTIGMQVNYKVMPASVFTEQGCDTIYLNSKNMSYQSLKNVGQVKIFKSLETYSPILCNSNSSQQVRDICSSGQSKTLKNFKASILHESRLDNFNQLDVNNNGSYINLKNNADNSVKKNSWKISMGTKPRIVGFDVLTKGIHSHKKLPSKIFPRSPAIKNLSQQAKKHSKIVDMENLSDYKLLRALKHRLTKSLYQQVKQLQNKDCSSVKPRVNGWTDYRSFVVNMYNFSPKVYRYLQKYIHLPCIKTLLRQKDSKNSL